jgi:hypothetical protein
MCSILFCQRVTDDNEDSGSGEGQYLETGAFHNSEQPPDYGSWTLVENTSTDTSDETTGSGLVGLTTSTLDSTQEMDRTDYRVGYPTLATYTNDASDTASFIFALAAPEPSNLQPLPGYAVSDEAVGKNLEGSGLWDLNTANSGLVDAPSGGRQEAGAAAGQGAEG